MSTTATHNGEPSEQRQHARIDLPVGYAAVRLRAAGSGEPEHQGHIYDLSEGGMRFELDQAIVLDEPVEVDLDLPCGDGLLAIRARGSAVRFHDEPADGAGPVRMGMQFDHVDQPNRLGAYLSQTAASPAA
jgi:c-di-GMP-binding flagellar brake protein YcgR